MGQPGLFRCDYSGASVNSCCIVALDRELKSMINYEVIKARLVLSPVERHQMEDRIILPHR